MPKRKRGSDDADVDKRPPSAKQARVKHKLHAAKAKLAHAFKVAKGFERQKLGRRKKNVAARKDAGENSERLDAEIVALKALDTTTFAQLHLHKSLLKIKAVSEHPDLPAEVRAANVPASDTATLNVHARLCKSNPVKEGLALALADLQHALGVSDQGSVTKRIREKVKGKSAKDVPAVVRKEAGLEADGAFHDANEDLDDGSVFEGGGRDAESAFDDRIASSSSDPGNENENSNVADLEQQLAAEGIHRHAPHPEPSKYDLSADMSISASENNSSRSPSPEPQKAPAPVIKKSSYLPSLTMGGYISGSGSDLDDDDIDIAAPKKNRRGQRARQQIWEQKFGTQAKHLKVQQSRSDGWDAKRGATEGSRGGRGGFRKVRPGPDYIVGARDAAGRPVSRAKHLEQPQSRDDGGALHPSWEAAKKAKERKEKPVAFEGKKITFD